MKEDWIDRKHYRRRRQEVYDEYDHICILCGRFVDITLPKGQPASPEVDHLHPRSRNGALNDIENLRPIHKSCNEFKSDWPLDVAIRKFNARNETSRVW